MAITRRQFVTRLGALAAAAGLGQADVSRITQAFGYGIFGGAKPKVVWVHGAECTGCSTSVLGLFEDATGEAIVTGAFDGTSTLAAIDLATDGAIAAAGDLTLRGSNASGLNPQNRAYNTAIGEPSPAINIADVLVDVIELDYHETVQNMGGDLAAQWLHDFMAQDTSYFVLVVEGAIQAKTNEGAWADAGTSVPWCSIGMSHDYVAGTSGFDLSFDEVVGELATQSKCAAVIAIGQCASFGGYPGCKSPLATEDAGFDTSMSQTGALGTYDFLYSDTRYNGTGAYNKVVNVPGCPTNPWWFVLTVVAWLVDANSALAALGGGTNVDGPLGILKAGGAINGAAVDATRRLKITYPTAIHGPYCPRFADWGNGKFAKKPGDPGCLQLLGCKGPAVKSLCGMHGWNAQQPTNFSGDATSEFNLDAINGGRGGHCTRAGHPCMGCTEAGYPDSFVPFVNW